jgi:Ca-activated chloride channel family protein
LLKQIADETGGRYFRAKDNEGLKNIYNEIDKLEKSRIETSSINRYSEKFLPFVIAAAIFLLLETLLRLTLLKKFP